MMQDKDLSTIRGKFSEDELVKLINTELLVSEAPNYVIGRLLFETIFHGNPDEVSNRDPKKKDSFRKLASRKDLNATYDWLYKSVKVVIQKDFLEGVGIDVSGSTYSHQVELLVLADGDEKIKLVKKLISQPLSVRRWRKEVQNLKPKKLKDNFPEFSKSLRNMENYLKNSDTWLKEISVKSRSLDSTQRKSLKKLAEEVQAQIRNIDGKYSSLINALEDKTPSAVMTSRQFSAVK
jgi:hypothetical protein